MERVMIEVEGMSCTNCALSIDKMLKQKGLQNVQVSFIGGGVTYTSNELIQQEDIEKSIEQLGYRVKKVNQSAPVYYGLFPFKNNLQRFWFCIMLTWPLLLHMIPGIHVHWLMNPWIQLGLTMPVYLVGMDFFGRSALKSLLKGIPNMNVLIAIGSTAAMVYSLYGMIAGRAQEFLFFETAATTITLVFLGNVLEDRAVNATQNTLRSLAKTQISQATMIAFDENHQELLFTVESKSLKVGDLLLIKNGEQVPTDCKILWGEAQVSEALISGESAPIYKTVHNTLIGGSILETGTIKAYVTAVGEDTVMSSIVKMIQQAEAEKPPIQQLADKISAVFVPAVVVIAVLTLLVNWLLVHNSFAESLLRSIAVLVISCPCAMGLATPAAVAVGLGRGAKKGILFKNAKSLELFKAIRQVVFDKTGTLTTGEFKIIRYEHLTMDETSFKQVVYSLERYSNHPIGKAITTSWKTTHDIRWKHVQEIKGLGMQATDADGNTWIAGSYQSAAHTQVESNHNIYVLKNNQLVGWIDIADEIRPEAASVIAKLKKQGIKTILLSGDRQATCNAVAKQLGIDKAIGDQNPQQKLQYLEQLTSQQPTAMVGDGINDGPALAKATVGISLSGATQIALNSAQVILMQHGLKNLPAALMLGRKTYFTIQENLFWAFIYNIIAIPIAAFGFLNPAIGALVMGFSDVVLAINSVRLNWKTIQ
jgi:P-type Cu+ transporter